MEVNRKMINSNINGVALHGPFEDEEEEEDFIQKVGMGRSYDCVFCRRGFTTAQALGGHMNVHRRDRITNNVNHSPINAKPSSSCNLAKPSNLYNLSPPSRRSTLFFDVLGGRGGPEGRLMGDDGGRCRMSLGSQGGGDGGGGGGGGEIRRASHGVAEKGKEDLDLELRLGYYPYW